ncbi:ATP-dependent zinc metalloprotease FtsH [Marinitenerispora sediminis]|uniref:ATP-dependent zinc metalloprotease FtsH n=1 Tax=Marinitenerispora sediminis TaxID=1931232 RepID=A0A368T2T8_9ACTN|nr:ATP-dependent zinc metalloprotease FtsH [Marinitenerispora sediminis]RCV49157.1 cell division protein FtsH [Marinitenerispora sediminis]RCV55940.1 cell division protein FtsH [Marinitenerispora sediminis]RCV60427.1 cell division protein FtsH [Marinitenerispora sediminis]
MAGNDVSGQPGERKRPEDGGPNRPWPWRTEGTPDREDRGSERPKFNWRRFLTTLAVVYLIFFAITWLTDQGARTTTIPYTVFTQQVTAGNVREVYSSGDSIEGTLKRAQQTPGEKGRTYTRFTTQRPSFADDRIYQEMVKHDVVVRATPVAQQRGFVSNLFWALLPVLVFGGFWWFLISRGRRLMAGGGLGGLAGIGSSRAARPIETADIRVTFDDVAGMPEVKDELVEVVDYLREPDRYRRLGAKLPKGVLLTGQPGTGKTLLARAVAGEAKVPFFSASAAEFVEMIVGVGASRIRELFGEARKVAPAIIFIDEIDTIGRVRGGQSLGANDEREQTLNQILTEMDGFTGTEGVVVVAATNRPDVLDPALLRPGRFDRTVTVNLPDTAGRTAILAVHARGVPLADGVDLGAVARSTPGMTGADLANLVNEAALLAAKRDHTAVATADFTDALEKLQLGAARSVVMAPEERERTAFHESGHALLGMLQPGADPVRKISIIPRGRSLGATLATPESDRYGYDESYLRGRIVGALGGMAAEELVYGVVTTGAESDLENATSIARQMVGRWGMSPEIGPMTVLPGPGQETLGQHFAPGTLDAVDAEARRIIEECHDRARDLLSRNRARLDALAHALLEHETLDEAAAYAVAGLSPRGPAAGGDRAPGTAAPGYPEGPPVQGS